MATLDRGSQLPGRTTGRRGFLRLTAAGGLVLLGSRALGAAPALAAPSAAGAADALLVNCMDYRLVDDVTAYMTRRGLKDKYDQIILAGASLGVATDKFPSWAETFWQHLDVAIELHQIHAVIGLNHRDCGAYRVALGQDFGKDPAAETAIHTQTLTAFRDLVKARHPHLEVELLMMSLDGTVEQIGGPAK